MKLFFSWEIVLSLADLPGTEEFPGISRRNFLLGPCGTLVDDEDLLFPKTARLAGLGWAASGMEKTALLFALWSVLPMAFVSAEKACLSYTSSTHF